MSKKETIVAENNIDSVDVSNFGIKVQDAIVTHVNVVKKDPETKKLLGEQRCDITGAKSRYLFTLAKPDGKKINVKTSVLENAGVSQKERDKLYSAGYYLDKPASSSHRMTGEEQTEALGNFLS